MDAPSGVPAPVRQTTMDESGASLSGTPAATLPEMMSRTVAPRRVTRVETETGPVWIILTVR